MSDRNYSAKSSKEAWRLHSCYDQGISCYRIVTRSQTPFIRLENSESDLELFMDKTKFQPYGLPHLMVTLKGELGAIPNTVITRSTGKHFARDDALIGKLQEYKENSPDSGEIAEEQTLEEWRSKSEVIQIPEEEKKEEGKFQVEPTPAVIQ